MTETFSLNQCGLKTPRIVVVLLFCVTHVGFIAHVGVIAHVGFIAHIGAVAQGYGKKLRNITITNRLHRMR